ncbi:PqiC family protein [Salinisphaera hydrothermalis]|uniref:PqiC family protein n=1 Tax=Salinisphaera hydrothermalis TaxID=563188 RepID=UPI00334147AA
MTPRRHSFIRRASAAGLLLSLALVAGCATTANSPSLFVLDSSPGTADAAPQPGAPTLMVAPVSTASYLDQGGLVYQTGPHKVVIANDNRWASSLSGQLTDDLYATLDQRLGGINVVRANSHQHDVYQLQTHVDQFLGHYDGNAHIAGRWTLIGPNGDTLAARAFTRRVPLKSDGYPALVSSLSSGWHAIGRDMAPALAQTIKSRGSGS